MSLPPLTWACCRGWSCPCCRCWWRTWPRSCRSSRRSSRTCSPTGSHWAGTRCGPSIRDLFSQCNYLIISMYPMILTCLHGISCLWSYSLQSDDNFKLFPAKNKDYPLCSLLNNRMCCRCGNIANVILTLAKMSLLIFLVSWKLRPYFQGNPFVLINYFRVKKSTIIGQFQDVQYWAAN